MNRHPALSVPLVLAAAIAAVAVCGCANVATPAPASSRPLQLRIDSGKTAEECLSLDAGDRVTWRFESTARVDFNIHFHRGPDVITAIDNARTQSESGALVAPSRENYCLTWKNGGAVPAFVTGELQRAAR